MDMTEKPIARISRATPLMPWLDYHEASDAAKTAAQTSGWTTLGETWDQCPDVGWLLWALARISYPDESVLRLFACRCVRETPRLNHHVVGDLLTDSRSWTAVDIAERFARGQASAEELTMARAEAWAAVWLSPVVGAFGAAAWAAQAAVWVAVEDAAAAAQTAAWAAARAAALTAQAVAWAASENTIEEEDRAAARTTAAKVGDMAQAEAAKFQAALLRQMIDPFHSNESK